MEGNILEYEWQNFTASAFQDIEKPVIEKVGQCKFKNNTNTVYLYHQIIIKKKI